MSEVDFDNDVTMAFDGVQQKWTFERLKQALEQGQLHEAADWTDDGAPLMPEYFEKDHFKNKGMQTYGQDSENFQFSQSWGVQSHGVGIRVLATRNYFADRTENFTSAWCTLPSGTHIDITLEVCNKQMAVQEMESYLVGREMVVKQAAPLAGVENDACSLYYQTEGACNG
jgi:hypothetical protein